MTSQSNDFYHQSVFVMSQQLIGKSVCEALDATNQQFFSQSRFSDSYLVNIFLGDSPASATYVRMKQKKSEQLGISMYALPIRGEHAQVDHWLLTQFDNNYHSPEEVLSLIDSLNNDPKCLGMLVQLPLPKHLRSYQAQILASIAPHKDVDGLWGVMMGLGMIGARDFLPATPQAVFHMLEYYELADFQGKVCVVLGQSNLIGKPLADALMTKGATVVACNSDSDQERVKKICRQSDYIFSATGVVHLISVDHVREDQSQVIVDIGWGILNGKAVGDVDQEGVAPLVKAITPVPGGVGPVTISALFDNCRKLVEGK